MRQVLALPLIALTAPASAALATPAPAVAQTLHHGHMPGMSMSPIPAAKSAPDRPAAKAKAKRTPARSRPPARKPARRTAPPATIGREQTTADPHAGHIMAPMPRSDPAAAPAPDPHASHAMSTMTNPAAKASPNPHAGHAAPSPTSMDNGETAGTGAPHTGTRLVTGTAGPPAPPADHAADAIWGMDAMRTSRAALRTEHGGQSFSMLLFNLAEYQARAGRDGYRWDGEGWYGGDIHRLTLKTEGEGSVRGDLESAEVQALYSRAVGPYWNLQAGVRHDVRPSPSRTYAVIGIEGLAPNNFDVEAAAFLSDRGDVLARLDGYYDQRLTQRLIVQPRAEINLAAQDMPAQGVGAGLVDAELGLRLRYEVRREFTPYVGLSWERRFGDTARFSRARDDDTGGLSFVAGIRTWF